METSVACSSDTTELDEALIASAMSSLSTQEVGALQALYGSGFTENQEVRQGLLHQESCDCAICALRH
eukprot:10994754-Karenia_brevis.AAC.1